MSRIPPPTNQPGRGTASIRPAASAPPPASIITTPATSRRRSDDSGIATSSRIAWMGAIRPVRCAGSHAAARVTTMPTTYAASTVRGARISDCPDRSRPKRPKRVRIAIASRIPSPRPMVEPTAPSTRASTITIRVTWRLLAPRARSSASSRLRWATRIEKVLTMRKPPTTREMPAKISRKVVRKPTASCSADAASSAASSPVTASTPSGSRWETAAASSSWLVPGSAVTQMSLKASLPSSSSRCAVRVSKSATVTPLREPPSGKPAMPTSIGRSTARSVLVTRWTCSPMV